VDFKNINQETIMTYVTEYGLQLVGAIVIFVIGKWLARFLTKFIKKIMVRSKVDETLISFAGNITYAVLLAFVILATLDQLGVETTSIAAIFAAAGLAVGFALQGSLSNLAAGVMIIAFRPFKIGDFVEAAGTSGSVNDISIFTTTLKTPDNKTVIIPNGSVTSSNVINYSAEVTRRIDLTFGIGYDDDIKKAKDTLAKIVAADDRILKDPEPTIAVAELADSSVNFVVRPWVATEDYWNVYFDLTEQVKITFDKENISIPFPQQDVHMHEVVPINSAKEAA